jgi:Uma2 family endonuclease
MIATPTKSLSLDEFLALPETEPASEYFDLQVIVKPMPQGKHSVLQMQLVLAINSILMNARIAIAFPELRCSFGGQSIVPDVVVFRRERIPMDESGDVANVFDAAPDWAVEILSPGQSSTPVVKKLLHCLRHGTELGWLINPAERSIFIYQPDKQVEVIDRPDQLLIVPTFAAEVKLTLSEVFAWLKLP